MILCVVHHQEEVPIVGRNITSHSAWLDYTQQDGQAFQCKPGNSGLYCTEIIYADMIVRRSAK